MLSESDVKVCPTVDQGLLPLASVYQFFGHLLSLITVDVEVKLDGLILLVLVLAFFGVHHTQAHLDVGAVAGLILTVDQLHLQTRVL